MTIWSVACDASESTRARVMHALLATATSELVLEAEAYLVVDDRVSDRLFQRALRSADARRGAMFQWRSRDAPSLRLFACYAQVSISADVYAGPKLWKAAPVASVTDGERLDASLSDDWFRSFLRRAEREQVGRFCVIEPQHGGRSV